MTKPEKTIPEVTEPEVAEPEVTEPEVTEEAATEEEEEVYEIVGSTEANSLQGKISNESPMALAIMGKKVGEVVEVSSPDGVYSVKIVAIG